MRMNRRVSEAALYRRTAQEESVVRNFVERQVAEMATQIKLTNENGAPRIVVNHKDEAVGSALLAEALGTATRILLAPLSSKWPMQALKAT